MYAVQKEPTRNSHMNHPASLARKYTPARAAILGYCQEPSESARNQFLGYTMASTSAPSHMSIQRVPDPDKKSFFDNLSQMIREHVDAAQPDARIDAVNKDTLWSDIKKYFKEDQNVSILISKILSTNTPGVEDQASPSSIYCDNTYTIYTEQEQGKEINSAVKTAFNGLEKPISQTLNDILYWTVLDTASAVSAIHLTDSDLHHRGVGVCIVEYRNNSEQKKIVVKPEDKTFDKAIYGKDNKSLANTFNLSLQNGALGETFANSSIGTLNIQISDNNAFGSAMEFFEHKRFFQMNQDTLDNIDLHSVEGLIAFSSLLGLADLHVENAVYSLASEPTMQLIDAEIGMKYLLQPMENATLLQTAMYKGEMLGLAPSVNQNSILDSDFENYDPNILSDFLGTAKQRLEGETSRIVLLPTPTLFSYRSRYLANPENWKTDSNQYYNDLSEATKEYYKGFLSADMKDAGICQYYAQIDFAAGRIPFFELHFSSGEVCQKLPEEEIPIVTYSAPKGGSFLDFMIQNRKDALAQEFAEIQEGKEAQERAEVQRNKKLLTILGLSALTVLAGGAGAYYLLQSSRGD